jgi:hypothetical protein
LGYKSHLGIALHRFFFFFGSSHWILTAVWQVLQHAIGQVWFAHRADTIPNQPTSLIWAKCCTRDTTI